MPMGNICLPEGGYYSRIVFGTKIGENCTFKTPAEVLVFIMAISISDANFAIKNGLLLGKTAKYYERKLEDFMEFIDCDPGLEINENKETLFSQAREIAQNEIDNAQSNKNYNPICTIEEYKKVLSLLGGTPAKEDIEKRGEGK